MLVHSAADNRTSMSAFSTTSARNNLSDRAAIDDRKLWAEGSFHEVYTGTYSEGPRKGQKCVAKWFKTGVVYDDVFFEKDIRAIGKALVRA